MNDKVIYESSKRITQKYGNGHFGVDLGARSRESENKIYPNCSGIVVEIQKDIPRISGSTGKISWGNYVLIRHSNGYYSRYAHLSTVLVCENQNVTEQTLLGYMGDSGNTTGRHLHFEVQTGYSSRTRINPEIYLTQSIVDSASMDIIYTAVAHDTLSKIASMYGMDYKTLAQYNHIDNPDFIFVGQEIKIPCSVISPKKVYTVKEHDTLSGIALQHHMSWRELYQKNKKLIDDTAKAHGITKDFYNYIYVGQQLEL